MTPRRYDRLTVLLHWSMAVLILAQIGLGLWMIDLPKDASGTRAGWFNVHKSLGIALLLLIALRLAWLGARPRVDPAPASAALQRAAHCSHALLYALMLLVPLSGFLGSVYSRYPIRAFGVTLPRLAAPWEAAKEAMSVIHQMSSYALIALIALHLLAVLLHQFVLRDRLLLRMR